jgi:Flp pilus assembly protein TadD
LAAYAKSLGGPFIFDDLRSIASNPTLHPLWPPGGVLHPPPGTTVSGRPLLNLSFAVDRALWGGEVPGYHAVNLLIHLLAGLILFGLVRRTWMRTKPAEGAVGASARAGTCIGFATALLWTVHPLQTESVTYLAQRAESLMGLLYFATLYSLVRGLSAAVRRRGTGWLALSVAACGAGMAVKEVMVTAPVLALLYDRTFAAGSFGAAVRRRALYYAALAACWLVLGGLMVQAGGNRNGSIGFGIGVSPWAYALTQLVAIPRYLELCFWPHPLIFEYGPFWVHDPESVIPGGLLVVALVAGTCWTTWKRQPAGFLGCWFLGILAPTSSIVPGATQMIVEHRMYLPLAAVIALVVSVGWVRFVERPGPGPEAAASSTSVAFCAAVLVLAVGLVCLTASRNRDYRSETALWEDTVAKRPSNPVAHDNLGVALLKAGRLTAAAAQFSAAIELKPDDAEAHNNLGTILVRQGRVAEAVADFTEAARLNPGYADAHFNLGSALAQSGRWAEAASVFAATVRLRPNDAEARNGLGSVLGQLGRLPEAAVQFEAAVRLRGDFAEARYNLAVTLAQLGRRTEAVAQLEELIRQQPGDGQARSLLAELRSRGPR